MRPNAARLAASAAAIRGNLARLVRWREGTGRVLPLETLALLRPGRAHRRRPAAGLPGQRPVRIFHDAEVREFARARAAATTRFTGRSPGPARCSSPFPRARHRVIAMGGDRGRPARIARWPRDRSEEVACLHGCRPASVSG